MKWLAHIFSCYLLVLSLVPCSDRALPVSSNEITVATHSEPAQHEPHSGADLCTPLCMCACCGVTTVFHTPIAQASQQFLFFTETHASYQPLYFQAVTLPIWQPPKLS